jgi:hypothetical protein
MVPQPTAMRVWALQALRLPLDCWPEAARSTP